MFASASPSEAAMAAGSPPGRGRPVQDLPGYVRSHSTIALCARHLADGATRRAHVAEAGSHRLRFPRGASGALEATLVNTAGGMAGGDSLALDITAEDHAALVLTAATAENIYRTLGAPTAISASLRVQSAATLALLPQETILHDGAVLHRSVAADLAADAALLLCDLTILGRIAHGERLTHGVWRERWRIRRAGRLVFAEDFRLQGDRAGDLAAILARPATLAGAPIAASLLFCAPGAQESAEALRAGALRVHCAPDRPEGMECAVGTCEDLLLCRFLGHDAGAIRAALRAAVARLGPALASPLAPPRGWLA